MQSRLSSISLLGLLAACGGSESDPGCPKAPSSTTERACGLQYFSATQSVNESREELERSLGEREKLLVPRCFVIGQETSCKYLPEENLTRCSAEAGFRTEPITFRVEWEDQSCAEFSGRLIRERRDSSTPPLLGYITRTGEGMFHIETVDRFGLSFTLDEERGLSAAVGSASCFINLGKRGTDDPSEVEFCVDG